MAVTTALAMDQNEVTSEDVRLRDGRIVRLRPVQTSDKERLLRAFQRLSPESRYSRFFGPKSELSPEELRFFTEVDGMNHIALGLVEVDADGSDGEGVAVGRVFRLQDEPEVAEIALAVSDSYQRQGLGRLLLERLLEAASEQGIKRIRCYVLVDNEPMRRLLNSVFGATAFKREEQMMVGDLEVPQIPLSAQEHSPPHTGTIFDMLRMVAKGAIALPVAFGLSLLGHSIEAVKDKLRHDDE